MLENPSFTSSPDVNTICRDYFSRLGLNLHYFGHGITYRDGRFSCLNSDAAWAKYAFCETDMTPAGYTLFDKTEDSIKLPNLSGDADMGWNDNAIRFAKERFGIENLMVIFKKYQDHLQCFFFDLHDKNAYELYINHLDIFENFIFYFKDKAQDLLTLTAKEPLMVPEHLRIPSKTDQDILKNTLQPSRYFLRHANKEYAVSPREYECLSMVAQGKKIKTVGDRLTLSARTVESHLVSVKLKLGVSTLAEAIEIYWQNRL